MTTPAVRSVMCSTNELFRMNECAIERRDDISYIRSSHPCECSRLTTCGSRFHHRSCLYVSCLWIASLHWSALADTDENDDDDGTHAKRTKKKSRSQAIAAHTRISFTMRTCVVRTSRTPDPLAWMCRLISSLFGGFSTHEIPPII